VDRRIAERRLSSFSFDFARSARVLARGAGLAEGTPVRFNRLAEAKMTVKFLPNDKGSPAGKLADGELHFSGGPLDGLKLIGFAVWERRAGGRSVTFPARQYTVNGERRSFALLRPIVDSTSQDRLRDIILEAYREHEAAMAEAV
jgi:hypothetical protein